MGNADHPHQNQDNSVKEQTNKLLDRLVPVSRSREDAGKTYDRLSRWYDLLAESSERKLRQKGIQLLNPVEGERILEIGYGTGRSVTELAELVGSSGAVYGLDLSSKMHAAATRRAARTSFLVRIHLSVGDAVEELPYSEDFFHGIFMNFTLELFNTDEFKNVLAECRRVLDSDGRLVVVSMDVSQRTKLNLMSKLYFWGHQHLPRLIDCRPIPTKEVLQAFGWRVEEQHYESTFGLPVSILRAAYTDCDAVRGGQ